jgi:hypothetical protein
MTEHPKRPKGFSFWVEDDRIVVRFVSAKTLGSLESGHSVGGDYRDKTIRIFRGELKRGQRSVLMHELAHYLVERQELRPNKTNEEEVCDLLTWLPSIFADERNDALLSFLGLCRE